MKFGQIGEREFKKTMQRQFEPIILCYRFQRISFKVAKSGTVLNDTGVN